MHNTSVSFCYRISYCNIPIFHCVQVAKRTKRLSMPYLELAAIVIALCSFGIELSNKRIIVLCDCLHVVHALNSLSSPNEPLIDLVRGVVVWCMDNNMSVKLKHIATNDNCLADPISRNQIDLFHKKAPFALKEPIPVSLPKWIGW